MTDYTVQNVDAEGKLSEVDHQYLILLPDGNWYSQDYDQARLGTSMHGDALGQRANWYRELGDAADTVAWLMKRAGLVGATDYRPVIYQRQRHTVWTTPIPSEEAETIFGEIPIVTADGKLVRLDEG